MFNSFRNTSLVQAFFLCFTVSFLGSCITTKSKIKPSLNNVLSQELISKNLAFATSDSGECIVYVSPLLKKRATIFNLNEFLDSEKLFPDYFESAQKSETFKLVIPDSLANRVYFINDSLDIENGIETFYFFSPLLPTKQKNIFAIECYNISTVQADIYTMRFIDRHYDIYSMKNKKLQFEKTIYANEDFFNLPLRRFKKK